MPIAATTVAGTFATDMPWVALHIGTDEEITTSSAGWFVDDTDDSAAEWAIPPSVFDWITFEELRAKWHEERGITSSLTKIVTCPSYLRIIGMGERGVPLILHQLQGEGDEPDFWFWALEAITGENPVSDDEVGDMRAMARAWLDWGRSR